VQTADDPPADHEHTSANPSQASSNAAAQAVSDPPSEDRAQTPGCGLPDLLRPQSVQCAAADATPGPAHYGTAVDFVDDPTAAARQALHDKKLLFVLHVAGNFEDSKFT
jgi:hypothetical protein